MKPAPRYSIAALALEIQAGPVAQVFPAGMFRANDGRPAGVPGWKLDAAIAARVIRRAQARANDFVVDYEHQTLKAEENGQPAPAAGWFKRLEWREGAGIYATDLAWTDRAKQMIEAREYRYFSPVFRWDVTTGEVVEILMAALTNVPAIDGMADLTERAAARLEFSEKETEMLKKVLTALGIAETAAEADVLAAVAALKENAGNAAALTTEIAALKAQTPDPAKYVPVAAMQDLQAQVTALKAENTKRELDQLVGGALAEGKLLPAQESWARELGAKDIAALKSYIATAQALPALRGTQTGGRGPAAATGGDIVAAAKAEFEGNAALREEFPDLAAYTAWRKAEAEGRVKVLGRTQRTQH